MLVNPKGRYQQMVENNVVEKRRDVRIQRAKELGDWDEVLRQLDLIEENLERKDRSYGLCSLNSVDPFGTGELLQTITDNQDPLTILIQKEESERLYQALGELIDIERTILLERVFNKYSFSKLARMYGTSDKTAKRYYENAIDKMEKIFKEQYHF